MGWPNAVIAALDCTYIEVQKIGSGSLSRSLRAQEMNKRAVALASDDADDARCDGGARVFALLVFRRKIVLSFVF